MYRDNESGLRQRISELEQELAKYENKKENSRVFPNLKKAKEIFLSSAMTIGGMAFILIFIAILFEGCAKAGLWIKGP